MTTTIFKAHSCIRCQNNFEGEGVLCHFCIDRVARNQHRNRRDDPPTCVARCLLEREGSTFFNVGNFRYEFAPNEHGHAVCEIVNPGHFKQICRMPNFEPYCPPVVTSSKPETLWPLNNVSKGDHHDPE